MWRAGLSTISFEEILDFYQILQVSTVIMIMVMVMVILMMIMMTMMLVTMII